MASIAAIFLRPSARTPVRRVDRAEALAGTGLRGDHAGGGNRQITVLDLDAWRAACEALGRELDPSLRRANVVIDGLSLAGLRGRRLRLGTVELELVGETAPCKLLDDAVPGLMQALRPDGRGGLYGRIESGGTIAVGDPVILL